VISLGMMPSAGEYYKIQYPVLSNCRSATIEYAIEPACENISLLALCLCSEFHGKSCMMNAHCAFKFTLPSLPRSGAQ
jgi:hypothetical protein